MLVYGGNTMAELKATENILNNVNSEELAEKLDIVFKSDIEVSPDAIINDDDYDYDDWEDDETYIGEDEELESTSIANAIELDNAFDLNMVGVPTKYDNVIEDILNYEEDE